MPIWLRNFTAQRLSDAKQKEKKQIDSGNIGKNKKIHSPSGTSRSI